MLENDIPVLIVTCTTQEVLVFRDPVTREIKVGQEDKVEQCTYGAVITRVPEELDNELTGGWKVVEVRDLSRESSLSDHAIDGKTCCKSLSMIGLILTLSTHCYINSASRLNAYSQLVMNSRIYCNYPEGFIRTKGGDRDVLLVPNGYS